MAINKLHPDTKLGYANGQEVLLRVINELIDTVNNGTAVGEGVTSEQIVSALGYTPVSTSTVGKPYVFNTTSALTHTGTTAITTYTLGQIPALDSSHLNAWIGIDWPLSWTGTNTKRFYIDFDNVNIIERNAITNLTSIRADGFIRNNNSLTSQFGPSPTNPFQADGGNTASSALWWAYAVDFTKPVDVKVRMETTNAADSITLNALGIKIWY